MFLHYWAVYKIPETTFFLFNECPDPDSVKKPLRTVRWQITHYRVYYSPYFLSCYYLVIIVYFWSLFYPRGLCAAQFQEHVMETQCVMCPAAALTRKNCIPSIEKCPLAFLIMFHLCPVMCLFISLEYINCEAFIACNSYVNLLC